MAAVLHLIDQRRLIDSDGISDGATIAFYQFNSLTPISIYADADLTSPLTNPVVVGAGAAVPDIYYDDSLTIRRIITYSDGSTDDSNPYTLPTYLTEAYASATAAAASANAAALYEGFGFTDVADLLADTTLTYTSGQLARTVVAGDIVRTASEGFAYEVAASGASDEHVTTAGGVKLYAVPDSAGFLSFEQLGAVGDGVTDDHDAFVAASGKKVRGSAGKTFFIDINGPSDSVRLEDETNWTFAEGCQIKWDYFGAPLFIALPDAAGWKVRIDHPQILYDSTAPVTLPHTNAELKAEFGTESLFDHAGRAYCASFVIFGVDDCEIINPVHRVVTPNTAGKSAFSFITVGERIGKIKGQRIVISDMDASDVCMMVLNSGYEEIIMPGVHRHNSYDDYTDMPWGPPGHSIYITGGGCNYFELETLIDKGVYHGSSADGPYNCVKLSNCYSFNIGSIKSYRPHGALILEDVTEGFIGEVFWSNQSTTVGNRLDGRAFYTIGTATSPLRNVYIDKITLRMPVLDVTPVEIQADAAADSTGLVIGTLFIQQDLNALTSGNIIKIEGKNNHIEKAILSLSGTTTRGLIVPGADVEDCYVGYRMVGTQKQMRISGLSATSNTVVEDLTVTADAAEGIDTNRAYELLGNNGLVRGIRHLSHTSRSPSSSYSPASTQTETLQLPGSGTYLVSFEWMDSVGSNGVQATYLVTYGRDGTGSAFGVAQQLGADILSGTAATASACSVTSAGVLTVSSTWSTNRTVGLVINYNKIGQML
tara:strand:- start:832 stop:3132 length:2301 start_codon:yes stop_codon:yes gene_type:complete